MKILVLTNLYPPDFIGGYELGCRQVTDALLGRGHEVRVLTSAPRTPVPPEPHVRRRLRLTDIWDPYGNHHSTPVARELADVEGLQINAFNVHALIEELGSFRPDVAYIWLTTGIGGLGLAACLQYLGVPWVWHLMDDVPVQLCRRGAGAVPALAREFGRQIRGHYLACSRQVVDEIQANAIRLGDEVEILPNWVAGRIPDGRSAYLPGGRLRIVKAGQIARHKGVDLLIEAARMLRDGGHDNFHVDIFGNLLDVGFSDMVRAYELDEIVAFPGMRTQSELMGLYGDYDLFAFPTNEREPFGFAPLEGAARGCVPVLTEVCGISEWLVDGVHCLKTPRTAQGLAGVFRRVLDGRVDLSRIGRRVASAVRRDFHLEAAVAPRIEAALERAARGPVEASGSPEEAYRLAMLAEKLARVVIQDAFRAA